MINPHHLETPPDGDLSREWAMRALNVDLRVFAALVEWGVVEEREGMYPRESVRAALERRKLAIPEWL